MPLTGELYLSVSMLVLSSSNRLWFIEAFDPGYKAGKKALLEPLSYTWLVDSFFLIEITFGRR